MALTPTAPDFPFGRGARVAVIGAGISGVTAAAHLLREGLSVTVFERSGTAGGVWRFDERTAPDPSYPSTTPSVGDYELSSPGQHALRTPPPEQVEAAVVDGTDERSSSTITATRREGNDDDDDDGKGREPLEIRFSPPGPAYAGLRNNVPTTLMYSALEPWPEGTEEFIDRARIERYVQDLARNHGVHDVTHYHTRVDEVRPSAPGTSSSGGWAVRTVTLDTKRQTQTEQHWDFDCVVAASGHYNLPRIPDTPGLSQWKAAFGGRVLHAKQYRRPDRFRGRNVLVIGAHPSALDICLEIGEGGGGDSDSGKVYQSARGGPLDMPASLLEGRAERVAEVARYEVDDAARPGGVDAPLAPHEHIPGRIVLKDGRVLEDIDYVILATGYIISYPFLPADLHSDTTPATDAGPDVIVTAEGEITHNLHKDIFYIPRPTLAFVGVPIFVATFSLFDFQSQMIARVFAGKAALPSEDAMRAEYRARREEKGLGRNFNSLIKPGAEVAYVGDLVEWANRDAKRLGVEEMRGHSPQWLEAHEGQKERVIKLLGLKTS